MLIKNISSLIFVIFFVSVVNLFSYTLPKEADMLKFLPDKVGNWQVDKEFDFEEDQLDDPSENPYYNKSRYADKIYKNGNKRMNAGLSAVIPWEVPYEYLEEIEELEENENDCKITTKNLTIQGFKAIVESSECLDGMQINSLMIEFVNNDDFYYNLNIDSTTLKGDEDYYGELASTDELINFANQLNLKGMNDLVK